MKEGFEVFRKRRSSQRDGEELLLPRPVGLIAQLTPQLLEEYVVARRAEPPEAALDAALSAVLPDEESAAARALLAGDMDDLYGEGSGVRRLVQLLDSCEQYYDEMSQIDGSGIDLTQSGDGETATVSPAEMRYQAKLSYIDIVEGYSEDRRLSVEQLADLAHRDPELLRRAATLPSPHGSDGGDLDDGGRELLLEAAQLAEGTRG